MTSTSSLEIQCLTNTQLALYYLGVDDFLVSTSNEKKAITLTKDLIALCESGGFRLTA